jgi:ATP-dependent RNA helicase DeaD
VDLPKGMPKEVFRILQKAWVCQKQLNISLAGSQEKRSKAPSERFSPKSERGEKNRGDANRGDANRGETKGKPKSKSGKHRKG